LNVKNTRSSSWFRTYIEIVDQLRQSEQLSQVAPLSKDRKAVILQLRPFASITAVSSINKFHPSLKNCFIKTMILC